MYVRKLKNGIICDYGHAEVQTKQGVLRGVESDGTFVFRGVKYAEAERFHMPQPPKSWEGVREAIVYGFVCPEIFTPVPHDQFTVPHYFGVQGEDCMNLNIWTRCIDGTAKRPVMVWLHGGGFFSGSGVEHYAYDGENLAKNGDVVVVTITHRLNVLGFLDLSEYGDEYRYSGNIGNADLVAALEWIRENIEAFGGDPDNVMIFGQSGGGAKVTTLLQTPAADGLYHRAVIQSGVGGIHDTEPEDARYMTKLVLEKLGIAKENIKEIETVSYYELSEAADYASKEAGKKLGRRVSWSPVSDGEYYIGHPFKVGFRKETLGIPLMLGTVQGEFNNNYASPKGKGSKNSWSEEYKTGLFKEYLGENWEEILEAFKAAYPEKNTADVLFYGLGYRKATMEYAKLRAASTDAGTYNFVFALESNFNGGTIAWHNAEIPYIFRNADYLEPSFIPGVTEKLQDEVSSAWVNFAKCGNPNSDYLPEWKQVEADCIYTMIFDRETKLVCDHDKKLTEILPDTQNTSVMTLIGKKK